MAKSRSEKYWYAFYLKSRTEKRVAARMTEGGDEVYLPLIKTMKQWNDRKKWVEEPLIKSYIFIRIPSPDIYRVLQTEGIVNVVNFSGEPAPIPERQIKALQQIIVSGCEVDVTAEKFEKGDQIEVTSGLLSGIKGLLVDFKGKHKMVIRIDNLQFAILVTINPNHIKKMHQAENPPVSHL